MKPLLLLSLVAFLCSGQKSLSVFAYYDLEAAPQQAQPFHWLLDSEQWGSKNENSIQPEGISNSCGGSVNLTSSLHIIEMGSFQTNTRCVWSIAVNTFENLEVYIDSFGFTVGESGITAFTFPYHNAYVMDRHKIPSGNQASYSFPAYGVSLLTLTSSESGSGSGFRLGLRGSGTADNWFRTETHQFRGTANDTFRSHSGNYSNYERSSVVIQPYPNRQLEVRVTYLDTEECCDHIRRYTPPPYHETEDYDDFRGFQGYHPFGPPDSTTVSTEPRFIVLVTSAFNTSTGYSLQWYS